LRNRWVILAVLFVVRLTMAFQFQSVAAVAPLLGSEFRVSLADIGILIGLYFTPGLAMALPGGAIGRRFGDKATVLGALILMLIGTLVMALSDSWTGQITGRLIGGAGGVLLNVQMTKMVADWFAGREIATAMAIFVNSWPAGIALSLLMLPLIGTAYSVGAVYLAVAALIGFGLVLLAMMYQQPANSVTPATASARLDRNAAIAVIAAGLIWGLYNVGFAIIFSFGPSMLVERGWSIAAAGSIISIVLWVTVGSVPLGGFLADRCGRPELILVGGCIAFANAAGDATARQHGIAERHRAWLGVRLAGRASLEPARARAAAGNAGDRHGRVLHGLLCHHDVRTCRRRRLRQVGGQRVCGIRFWRRCACDLSRDSLGLQSPSGGAAESGMNAPHSHDRC
jgi:MFS family permease